MCNWCTTLDAVVLGNNSWRTTIHAREDILQAMPQESRSSLRMLLSGLCSMCFFMLTDNGQKPKLGVKKLGVVGCHQKAARWKFTKTAFSIDHAGCSPRSDVSWVFIASEFRFPPNSVLPIAFARNGCQICPEGLSNEIIKLQIRNDDPMKYTWRDPVAVDWRNYNAKQ